MNKIIDKLINSAIEARRKAYAPYSKFRVGAAIESQDGKIYTGCNIENNSYGLTICAERVAIFRAISEGVTKLKRMVLVGPKLITPCGACRQVIREFSEDIEIILVDKNKNIRVTSIKELLPFSFYEKSLSKKGVK